MIFVRGEYSQRKAAPAASTRREHHSIAGRSPLRMPAKENMAQGGGLRQYSPGEPARGPVCAATQNFMQLTDVVEIYKGLAGEFDRPVELELFGLSHEETEKLFGAFDEDYHISRFFHFAKESTGISYSINGFPYTHVTIDAAIQEIL
jgi:hypothetical protein